MKSVLLVAVFAAAASAEVAVSQGSFLQVAEHLEGNCFPECKWQCDQPSCPAVCEPQCEKPSCELRCEKLPATSCDIRCEKPSCEVRCSRTNCKEGGCPICENVCMPAKCQTVCTPATPVCKPTCSAPKCTWSCKKPASCPKPKCNLGCAARAGGSSAGCGSQGSKCCSCNQFQNQQSALEIASMSHMAEHGVAPHEDLMPSFVEVAHEFRMSAQNGAEQCCPCN